MQVLRALKTAGQFNLAQGTKNRRKERKTFLQKKTIYLDEMVIPVCQYTSFIHFEKNLN